jgi:hypothetical protein
MPQIYKTSVIKPLYKKGANDPDSLNSYRPVSNLAFLAKIIERIVSNKLMDHLTENQMLDAHQHAYKAHHSCETALLCIHNAAITAIDEGKILMLVMLDLSAAFDMVDHDLLLRYCENMGVCGEALEWLKNYLSQRYQFVSCNNDSSSTTVLKTGVPQGSVLGPLLFSIYISRISDILSKHPEVGYVLYADDIQLYISCGVSEANTTIMKLEDCINSVRNWLISHRLRLNIAKTDFIIFQSVKSSFDASTCSLVVDNITIHPKNKVRDLGIILDNHIQMDDHIANICKNAIYYLRLICRCRQFLNRQTTTILVYALVMSRIDYCSALLYGVSAKLNKKVDGVIRYGMRVIEGLKRKIDVAPYLAKHGWLSLEKRSQLRIALLTHKIHNLNLPKQLAQLVTISSPSSNGRILRSSTHGLLEVVRTRTRMGDRTFATAAPKIWNALPIEIRDSIRQTLFKSKVLKHYLS